MIVRRLQEARKSKRRISSEGFESVRLLLKNDEMNFSFHITTIYRGAELQLWYQNHLESVYCIQGEGEIEDLRTGEKHPISPGMIYALDKHDKHVLRAHSELELACVFSPALHGTEVHNKDGSYELAAEEIKD